MKQDIIFIGAGPIGLLAAIQLKLKYSDKEVLMFEKYAEPVRNHAMYVDKSSFAGMDRSNGFGELLDSIPSKITISEFEKKLRAFAKKINVNIEYKEVTNFNSLKEEFPDTKYFVGSGGLKGIIHAQEFKSEKQIDETLRYAAEVKYRVEGKIRPLSKLTELPGVLSNTKHLVSEYVGHEKDGFTPISLRIFINEETFNGMKDATFKNPYKLSDKDKLDSDLLDTITIYLSARKEIAGEIMVEDSLKISTIKLSIQASKFFSKQEDDIILLTIGEESFACPFYRSFNDNATTVPDFIKTMARLFDNKNEESKKPNTNAFFSSTSISSLKDEETPLEYYRCKIQKLIDSEIKTIHLLNSGIDLVESSVASSKATHLGHAKLMTTKGGRNFLDKQQPNNSKADTSFSGNKKDCRIV